MHCDHSELKSSSELRAGKLINEFLTMDPIEKSKLNNGFITSIIEPFLGKREQFNKILEEELNIL